MTYDIIVTHDTITIISHCHVVRRQLDT